MDWNILFTPTEPTNDNAMHAQPSVMGRSTAPRGTSKTRSNSVCHGYLSLSAAQTLGLSLTTVSPCPIFGWTPSLKRPLCSEGTLRPTSGPHVPKRRPKPASFARPWQSPRLRSKWRRSPSPCHTRAHVRARARVCVCVCANFVRLQLDVGDMFRGEEKCLVWSSP